jgi:hypothetical protein
VVLKNGKRVECAEPFLAVNGFYLFRDASGIDQSVPAEEVDVAKTAAANPASETAGPASVSTAVQANSEFKAGGVALTLPGPPGDFLEVGDRLRTTVFELLAPSTNRLLSAYVPSSRLVELKAGNASHGLGPYAMVEVPREAEYLDCGPREFEQALQSVGPYLGKADLKASAEPALEEFKIRLRSLGAKPLELGRFEMPRGLFRKTDAAGFLALMAGKSGDRSVNVALGMALLRVKQRLLLVLLGRKYESLETVTWVHENLETWCDAILANNR